MEDQEELQIHVLENHTCEPCNKTFQNRGNLLQHAKAVHDKETFKCEFCSKTYFWKNALNEHIKSVHKDKMISVSCKFCRKSFESNKNLMRHVTVFHDQNPLRSHASNTKDEQQATLNHHIASTSGAVVTDFPITPETIDFEYEIKKEIKTEIKTEINMEIKMEIKTEIKMEPSDE